MISNEITNNNIQTIFKKRNNIYNKPLIKKN